MRLRLVLLAVTLLAMAAAPAHADVAVPCASDVPLGQPSAQSGQALVAALLTLYDAPGSTQTLGLTTGCTYLIPAPPTSGTTAQTTPFHWYGPSGLPAIDGDITIDGNGATLERQSSEAPFRFFFVGADPNASGYTSPGAGSLTLQQLTLTGGLAQGGGAKGGGGGGGFGGAIYNQGALTITQSTINGNTAQGGSGGAFNLPPAFGGGGIGQNANSAGAGGFGPGDFGGPHGGAHRAGDPPGGGGAGFAAGENGGRPTASAGGDGGGPANGMGGKGFGEFGGTPGDGGDGSGGGGATGAPGDGSDGGDFGHGGGSGGTSAGGGGVGGGGGSDVNNQGTGGGGFGGGGAEDADGGFGGGGGGEFAATGGNGGFAAGDGGATAQNVVEGGGGAGLGGAIFNHQGTVTIRNTTLAANTAAGGQTTNGSTATAGQGRGGAIFNLNGHLTVTDATIDANTADGGGGIYDVVYDSATARTATATLVDTILANSGGGSNDLVANKPASTAAGANLGSATVTVSGNDVVETHSEQGTGTINGSPLTQDPGLGPLLYSGGLGMKVKVPSGSGSAFGAGTCPLTVDEVGNARPGGAACEIGAVEIAAPPVCAQLTLTVVENTATPIGLDCGSGGVGYASPSPPAHGTLTAFSQFLGTATYTPAAGYLGTDSFVYAGFTDGGASNVATVHITVVPPPPVCTDLTATVTAGVATQLPLPCTGQAMTYLPPGSPAHGSLSAFSSVAGTITYTPAAGYAGPDTFTFSAINAGGTSNTATAHITINAPPAKPLPPPAPPPPAPTAPQLALACAHSRLVLLDVLPAAHRRVRISGVADPSLAGKTAAVMRDRTHPAGTLAIGADGSFDGTVKPPPASDEARARYLVRLGTETSASLKLERRMVLPPPTITGGQVRLSGQIVKPLPRAPQNVVITRATSCNGFTVIATVKAHRDGTFSALVPLPPAPFRAAFYRAQTLVPRRAGGPAHGKTYTLPEPAGP